MARRRFSIALLCAGLTIGGCRDHGPLPRLQRVDLLASLDRAERRPRADAIAIALVTLGGKAEPAIEVPAISRIVWSVRVPDRAVLRTALGWSPSLAAATGSKALFRIGVSDERTYDELLTEEIGLGAAAPWKPVALDLSTYGGFKWSLFYHPREKTWKVIFNTTIKGLGRPVDPKDRLFWAHPAIEQHVRSVDSTRSRM
jgi:hypothetical protein